MPVKLLFCGILSMAVVVPAAAQDIRQPNRSPGQQRYPAANPAPNRNPQSPSAGPGRPAGAGQPAAARPGTTQPRGPQNGPGAARQRLSPADAVQAARQQQAIAAIRPAWANLPPQNAKHVDDILRYWQATSDKIKTYQCRFQRWKYDPVFVPRDAQGKLPPQEYSTGEIKYQSPDKALYKDIATKVYQAATKPGEPVTYKALEDGQGHHWICDGAAIFEFDAPNKRVIKTELPQELRGEALMTHGPLPFLFGAKADDIKRRYWVRVITPANVKDEYHLEAYPKSQADAASFQFVHIHLDQKMYLPLRLIVYNVNYDPVRNPARTTYTFSSRRKNPINIATLASMANPWRREFYEPPVPKGWVLFPNRIAQAPPNGAAPGPR